MVCGFDIGGHTISAGTVTFEDGAPRVVSRVTVPSPAERDIVALLERLAEIVLLRASPEVPCFAGLAVPGFIDTERKKIVRLTNFVGCDGAALGAMLAANLSVKKIRLSALMENDANCAALGEGAAGAAAGLTDYAVVTLGTGIGCGIVTGGRLLRGAHGMAGEFGHITSAASELPCKCGGQCHLETAASADGTETAARAAGLPPDFKTLWLRRNEPAVAKIISPALEALASALASLTALLDPQCIVLSGGMSRAEELVPELASRMQKYLSSPFREYCRLKISSIGADAPIIGAASLFFKDQYYGDDPK